MNGTETVNKNGVRCSSVEQGGGWRRVPIIDIVSVKHWHTKDGIFFWPQLITEYGSWLVSRFSGYEAACKHVGIEYHKPVFPEESPYHSLVMDFLEDEMANTTQLPAKIPSPKPQYGINYSDFAGSHKVNSSEELIDVLSRTQGTKSGGFVYVWSSGEVIYGWSDQEEAWMAEAGKRKWRDADSKMIQL